jgi:hypothetical protein
MFSSKNSAAYLSYRLDNATGPMKETIEAFRKKLRAFEARRPPRIFRSECHGILLTVDDKALAQKARALVWGQDVLYHGTRHSAQILEEGVLRCAPSGTLGVFFSRSPEVAAYTAGLYRGDARKKPAILIFCRASLQTRYRIVPRDDHWIGPSGFHHDEAEELTMTDITDVYRHLIAVVRL